ncbi:MAG: transketolase [Halanaerobiales bacterium]
MNNKNIENLENKAVTIRENILETIGVGKKGHVGGSMSSADLVTALYFYKMNHDPKNPEMPDRDRFVFSKGHSVLAQYAALAEAGYFSKEELKNTKKFGCTLQGHPEIETPGIEANTGSLGQGLSLGLGMALGGKLDNLDYNVYVIIGDGEIAEGQIWEAVNAASHHKADNLVAILDRNNVQATGTTDIFDCGNIRDKFNASGWKTFEIDGHNMKEIVDALDKSDKVKGKPKLIIANTVKGKGVSFAENKFSFHNAVLTEEQYKQAREDVKNMKTEVKK